MIDIPNRDDKRYFNYWAVLMKALQRALRPVLNAYKRRYRAQLHYILIVADHDEEIRFGDVVPQFSSTLTGQDLALLLETVSKHIRQGDVQYSTATWDADASEVN